MALRLLTDEDIAFIRELRLRQKSFRVNAQFRFTDEKHVHQASDVYLAKPQSANGIPARVGDTPGSDVCDIAKIDSVTGDITAITGLTKTVYNLSETVIDQDWVIIWKTKAGKWVAGDDKRLIWAKAQADWVETDTINPTVSCKQVTDETGGTETGNAFTVLLPRMRAKSDAYDPSVYEGDVILIQKSSTGDYVCKTPYLSSAIGDIKETGVGGKIPTGWQVLEGAKQRFTLQVDSGSPETNEQTIGDTGGFRWHGDFENSPGTTGEEKNNHPDHPAHVHGPGQVTRAFDTLGEISVNPDPGSWPRLTEPNAPTSLSGTAHNHTASSGDAGGHDHSGEVTAEANHSHTVTTVNESSHTHGIAADITECWAAFVDGTTGGELSDEDQLADYTTTDLRNHLGPFKGDTTTDNRSKFYVVQRIIRWK